MKQRHDISQTSNDLPIGSLPYKAENEYHSGSVHLYQMDCMDLLRQTPDKYYDLSIVDPPYGIGLDMVTRNGSSGKPVTQANGKKYETIHKHKNWNDAIPTEQYFLELHRVSKNQIIWGCNYYAKYIPAVGRIVHDKIMGIEDTKINYSHADLASCSLQKRITMFRYRWSGNKQGDRINWENVGPDGRIHPTQKPISLYSWCLKKYAKPGDSILDTHLGSGSIAIAAFRSGYNLVGCEIDKEYYEAACKRFKEQTMQQTIF